MAMFAVVLGDGQNPLDSHKIGDYIDRIMRQFPGIKGQLSALSNRLVAWGPTGYATGTLPNEWHYPPGHRAGDLTGQWADGEFTEALIQLEGGPADLCDQPLVFADVRKNELRVARDPMGLQPVYYRCDTRFVAAASTAAALKLPGLPLTVDPAWLAQYSWMNQSEDLERTPFQEIRKVPPGHMLVARPGQPPTIRRWFDWDEQCHGGVPREADWADAFREVLLQAVSARLGPDRPVAVEASGGLDSSALLAAVLRSGNVNTDDVLAIGYALCEQEPAAIARVLDHLAVNRRMVFEAPDVLSIAHVDRALAAIGYPEQNSIASSYWRLLSAAANNGARVLLSGYGGDEIVSRPAVEARHDMVAAYRLGDLYRSFPGGRFRRAAATAWHLLPRPPSPSIRAARENWASQWAHNLLTDDADAAFGIGKAHALAFDDLVQSAGVNATIRSRFLPSAAMATRFESCYLVGRSYGVGYVWPLCDWRLINLYLAAPATEKFGPQGMGRYLHRRGIAPWLPHDVALRPAKSMGPPRDPPLKKGLALSDWASPDLAPMLRGIIDPDKVDRARKTLSQANGVSAQVLAIRSSLARLAWLNRWLENPQV